MKTTRRFATLTLALVMLMSIMATSAFAATFTDVPEKHWSYEYVEKAYANGLVNGVGNGKYNADANVSNAEWCQMVANLFFGGTVPKAMENDPWWWPAVEYSANAGYLVGTTLHENGQQVNRIPFKTDAVNASVNRYDMAMVIYNIANSPDLDVGTVNTAGISAYIADYQKIPTKYQKAVEFCYATGFITGVNDAGKFDGTAVMNRAQAATVLCRLFDAKNGNWTMPTFGNTETPSTSNTAVKDMIKVESTGTNRYGITVNNTYTAGKLANGKDINATNITAMLAEIKALYPAGTSWGDGNGNTFYGYGPSNPAPTGGGCNSFAGMVGDVVFGRGATWTSNTNVYDAKPGDLIELKDSNGTPKHWVVVMTAEKTITKKLVNGVPTEFEDVMLTVCEGNKNSEVRWGTENTIASYLTSYPKSVLYTAY